MKELNLLLPHALQICVDTANFIQEESHKLKGSDIHFKGKNDLVSYVDQQAEKMLVEKLQKLLPEAGFLTEEKTVVQEDKALRWIIDPLDGTTNFIHGLPVYCTSVALMDGEDYLMGIIIDPSNKEHFYASKGNGAFCNGERIQVSKAQTLANSLVATGFPYTKFELLEDYLKHFKSMISHARGVRRMGSAAIDLAYVACGRFDVFFEYQLNAWDIASGILLVKEAGGEISDFQGGGNFLFGGEILATNSQVHREVLDLIKSSD